MLEIFEKQTKWENHPRYLYQTCLGMKLFLIKKTYAERKKNFTAKTNSYLLPILKLDSRILYYCNEQMAEALMILANHSHEPCPAHEFADVEYLMIRSMSTSADKVYYSQFLIFIGKMEEAATLLKEVVELEGEYSLSMVIWSRKVCDIVSPLDGSIREELAKSSDDYVVFPTNFYARYLLLIVYCSLGQEEQRRSNLEELLILRQRYSEIPGMGSNVEDYVQHFE